MRVRNPIYHILYWESFWCWQFIGTPFILVSSCHTVIWWSLYCHDAYMHICPNICLDVSRFYKFKKMQTKRENSKSQKGYTKIKKYKSSNTLHIYSFLGIIGQNLCFVLIILFHIYPNLSTREDDTMSMHNICQERQITYMKLVADFLPTDCQANLK